jgi:hypothetical protein
MKINLSNGIFLIFGIFLASYVLSNPVQGLLPSATGIGVIIDTPPDSANLPVGDLTIYGTSSDNNSTNCQVFADWNDLKPMQEVTATGPKGISDYSKWSFTYTGSYHGIAEGTNELTSKITCHEQGQNASSKSYSINVTGIEAKNEITNNTAQESTKAVDTKDISNESNNILPMNSNTSNTGSIDNTNTSTEDVANEDVSVSDVSSKDVAVEDEANEDVSVSDVSSKDVAVEDEANEDNNILPMNSNTSNTNNINNTTPSTEDVAVVNEDVSNEDTNISPVEHGKNGTYKILPLYSESDEESTTSTSSEDSDQTYIRNMKTAGSQDGINSTETSDTDSGTYNTFSSEQQGTIGETNNMEMTSTEASDEGLTSHDGPNTFFTYEPDLIEDTSNQNDVNTFGTSSDSNQNDVNTFGTSSDTQNSLNHKIDDNSIFGLKYKGLDDVTKNNKEKRIEKLEDKITDRMSMFDLIG